MNNMVKIIVAGGIATLLQRNIGLNPISLEGFAFFMVVFVLISLVWQYFFPQKPLEMEAVKETEALKIEKKRHQKELFLKAKKAFLIVVAVIVLNALVNFLSFKLGLFDGEFKYRFDTSKAVALKMNEEAQTQFQKGVAYYFLYPYKDKFYLVMQKTKDAKPSLLTLYSKIDMSDVYEYLKNEKNFAEVLKNISPIVYREVSLKEMLFKPLWLANSIEHIYWTSEEYEKYKSQYEQSRRKKPIIDNAAYRKLLNQEVKFLDEKALLLSIKKMYDFYAYTRDTRFVLSLFDEYDKKATTKDKSINPYRVHIINYLYLFRTKEKLNEILKKYDMGVVYTFDFWENQPLDIALQEHSLVRLVSLKDATRTLLWQDNIENIEALHDRLKITFKDKTTQEYTQFKTEDIQPIKLKLTSMIQTVYKIEESFYTQNRHLQ